MTAIPRRRGRLAVIVLVCCGVLAACTTAAPQAPSQGAPASAAAPSGAMPGMVGGALSSTAAKLSGAFGETVAAKLPQGGAETGAGGTAGVPGPR